MRYSYFSMSSSNRMFGEPKSIAWTSRISDHKILNSVELILAQQSECVAIRENEL